MGAALWKRVEVAPAALPAPSVGTHRYRIETFGEPRAPWRSTPAEAFADAIRLELASWDEERQEYFLAVPVNMRTYYPPK